MEIKRTKRSIANCYRKGAAWLEKNPTKWCVNTYSDGYGNYCAVGAIGKALGLPASDHEPEFRSIKAENYVLDSSLNYFNDHVAEDVGQVIVAMRRVARALEHGAPL